MLCWVSEADIYREGHGEGLLEGESEVWRRLTSRGARGLEEPTRQQGRGRTVEQPWKSPEEGKA